MSLNQDILSILILTSTIIATPGPNNTILATAGLNYGFVKTVPKLLSINIGVILAVSLSLFFTDFIQKNIGDVSYYMRIISFSMLVYISWGMWPKGKSKEKNLNAYFENFQLFIFQMVNPKIWIMSIMLATTYADKLDVHKIILYVCLVGLLFNSIWVFFGVFVHKLSLGTNLLIDKISSIVVLATAFYFLLN